MRTGVDGACPLGPWIIPASDIADPHALGIRLEVNDELMQDSNTGNMIFNTAEQIAMLSSRVTLQPGERVKLWIERIGKFSHKVA
jgi:2-keto-4-pentenoate hydratase/2-oxohepta-3-ene-1,7-dioic acid hydratase in catechol pathway